MMKRIKHQLQQKEMHMLIVISVAILAVFVGVILGQHTAGLFEFDDGNTLRFAPR